MVGHRPRSTLFPLHDALPIFYSISLIPCISTTYAFSAILSDDSRGLAQTPVLLLWLAFRRARSEEHTSELQSQFHLVCRLLLEKKIKVHEAPDRTDESVSENY